MSYNKQDTTYMVVQQTSLRDLVVKVNKILEDHNNHSMIRIEGGILHEESLGTYAQVIIMTEYVAIPEVL